MKIIITWVLLISFAFSTVHEYAFALYDENHCNISEYTDEFSFQGEHHNEDEMEHDICDVHFGYHHAMMLPQNNVLIEILYTKENLLSHKKEYHFNSTIDFFRPPRA